MATHKLTLKQKRELKQFYKDGARDVDLAEWFGISEATVRFHTKEFRRPAPRRTFDYDRAKRLVAEGMTKEAVGARLGVWGASVGKALKRMEQAA